MTMAARHARWGIAVVLAAVLLFYGVIVFAAIGGISVRVGQ